MALLAGTRLGPYEILSPIGAGGMGEVYKAKDTRLERTVAVKVLPQHLSASPEVRQRFEREAKTISQLSHPHICALYDVGREGETEYLVMEHLEGDTLTERLARGALPTEQLLRYGMEIADALDKAHRQGIVHRDLKPGNVMITKSGVKLLDFGLAKAMAPVAPRSGMTSLPTVASAQNLTEAGTVLGTFQYMAPEQLEGKEADARSDIFAFGCVLYEMATGRKAFGGKSQASLIASILEHEPPLISSVQPLAPPALDRVVKTCLAKDPEDRWQTAHDLKAELKWIADVGSQAGVPAPIASRRKNRERMAWMLFGLAALAAAVFAAGYLRRAPQALPPVRASLVLPEKMFLGEMAISTDGRQLAFTAWKAGAGGEATLWIRPLDGAAAQQVPGVRNPSFPFWSPDGRSVAFFEDHRLKRVDAAGGTIQTICDAERGVGGTWNPDGTIVFAPAPTSNLYRVSASGGQPVPVTKLDASRKETAHRYPFFLPDGHHFLYMASNLSAPVDDPSNAVRVGSLDGKLDRALVRTASNAGYASGRLLYAREGTLFAQRLDTSRWEVQGEPSVVGPHAGGSGWQAFTPFCATDRILLLAPAWAPPSQLLWLDRTGKLGGSLGEPGFYQSPRLSPDGRRVAVDVADPARNTSDIWIFETSAGTSTKFVFGAAHNVFPVWSPQGDRIFFGSDRKSKGAHADLWVKSINGAGEEIFLDSPDDNLPEAWSSDGRFLSFLSVRARGNRHNEVWILSAAEGQRAFAFAGDSSFQGNSRFSPDGRWLAYDSNESGKMEVYVRPFPGPGGKWQVSTSGGAFPHWRGDGKELFYLSADNKIMAVPVRADPTFQAVAPMALFPVRPAVNGTVYDVSADGQRFLVNSVSGDEGSPPLTLLVDWATIPGGR